MVRLDPRHAEQHDPLPHVLAGMPGGALQIFVQHLRAVIGLHRLAPRLVRRRRPPSAGAASHPRHRRRCPRWSASSRAAARPASRRPACRRRDFQERLGDAEDVVAKHAVAARPVRHLGRQLVVRHLRDHADRGTQEPSSRVTSSSGDNAGPVASFRPRNLTTWPMFCANT